MKFDLSSLAHAVGYNFLVYPQRSRAIGICWSWAADCFVLLQSQISYRFSVAMWLIVLICHPSLYTISRCDNINYHNRVIWPVSSLEDTIGPLDRMLSFFVFNQCGMPITKSFYTRSLLMALYNYWYGFDSDERERAYTKSQIEAVCSRWTLDCLGSDEVHMVGSHKAWIRSANVAMQ